MYSVEFNWGSCCRCCIVYASGKMIVSYWDWDAFLWLTLMRTLLFHFCLRTLPIRFFVYFCFPFAIAYLDVSFFCHIFCFDWVIFFGWCDVVQLMLTCQQLTDVWSFLVLFFFLSLLFCSFLSQCDTSRLPLDPCSKQMYAWFFLLLWRHILMAFTYVYLSRGFHYNNNNIICKQFL